MADLLSSQSDNRGDQPSAWEEEQTNSSREWIESEVKPLQEALDVIEAKLDIIIDARPDQILTLTDADITELMELDKTILAVFGSLDAKFQLVERMPFATAEARVAARNQLKLKETELKELVVGVINKIISIRTNFKVVQIDRAGRLARWRGYIKPESVNISNAMPRLDFIARMLLNISTLRNLSQPHIQFNINRQEAYLTGSQEQ